MSYGGYNVAPAGGGGGSTPMVGARNWGTADYYQTAAAQCPGDVLGFEITVCAIVENLRNATNIMLSAWDTEFNGPGYQLFTDTIRADLKIKTSGGVLQQFIGNRWVDDYQGYVLVVLTGGYNAGTNSWFLRLNDIELFNATLGALTFTPSATGVLRMGTGAFAPTNSPALNTIIVGAAYKGGGVLTADERQQVMRAVLVDGDLPDVSYTNRWSFAGLAPATGYAAPLLDLIGTSDMTATGTVDIVEVKQAGRPTMGTGLTIASTSEGGFMTTTDKTQLAALVAGTLSVVSTAINAAIGATVDIMQVDTTAGPITLTPPALGNVRGVLIQKIAGGANGIIIARTAAESINGVAANYTLPDSATAWASATPQGWYLYSNGTNRFVT